MRERESLLPAASLIEWFDGFVGSEEERAMADALLHVALAAERIADPRLYPGTLWPKGDMADVVAWMNGVAGAALSELREALEQPS